MKKTQSRAAAWLSRLTAVRGKKIIAWAVAVAVIWTVDVVLAVRELVPPDVHGLTDCSTACITVLTGCWLLIAHFASPRLKPGQRIVSDDDYRADQRLFMEMLAIEHHENCIQPRDVPTRDLRAV